jgi:hypothetical protein
MSITVTARSQKRPGRPGSMTGRLQSALAELADRAHAAGDARARARGWTVTAMPGLLGLSGRSYRDPRFTTLRPDRGSPASLGRPA